MTMIKSILFMCVCALGVSLLQGCAHVAGYAGSHPAVIECKGKGAITGIADTPVAGGNFSINADCGDGFIYKQSKRSE